MTVLYFYNRNQNKNIYDIRLEAYLEIQGRQSDGRFKPNFRCIENLWVYLTKDPEHYQFNRICYEFGKDTARTKYLPGQYAFTEEQSRKGMVQIDRRNYERFRKVALALTQRANFINFSDFDVPQNEIEL